jgi:uncharacterized protein
MDLKAKLQADMAAAMRAGAAEQRNTLRLLLAAVQQVEVDERRSLSDDDVAAIIARQAKQLRESISDAEKAGRSEMAAAAAAELAIVESYLPQMLDRATVRARAAQVIEELGVSDPKEMGRVMSRLMAEMKGQADGRLVTEVVRELLPKQS